MKRLIQTEPKPWCPMCRKKWCFATRSEGKPGSHSGFALGTQDVMGFSRSGRTADQSATKISWTRV
jgi:hypothetical protein